ncbi:hypothetical protein H4219_000061 [Mycoemilia scoparia]|uniref:Uncharacterized protein n=1 Tax=Mycoemilia scoparia TaxID=417184 RepID=A0A9W8ACJ4_9FUNG|nr:hypothetical protein H4219_000061 [Mycoemilia scoparia]
MATTFKERGLMPPKDGAVTLGEVDLNYIHISSADDPAILKYASGGGVIFPHIMLPETLGLKNKMPSLPLTKTFQSAKQQQTALPVLNWLDPVGFIKSKVMETLGPYIDPAVSAAKKWLEPVKAEDDKISEKVIGCMAWHPHKSLLAIVHKPTDSILVYDMAADNWYPNMLRHEKMTDITSLSWQPNGGLTLAAGCSGGVALWRIIPPQRAPWMTLLGCGKISAVEFDPTGQWLLAGGETLHVWDVALETKFTIRRSGKVSSLAWSPNGECAYTRSEHGLRVWDAKDWSCQVWKERIRCACWTSDSQGLFFTTEGGRDIYMLMVHSRVVSIVGTFTNCRNDDVLVGGAIDSIALDPTGNRLILSFVSGDEATDPSLLAVYFVHGWELMPGGFIRGPSWGKVGPKVRFTNPTPTCMTFASQYLQGSLLTIAWANGKVSFIPMHFATESTQ